MCVAVFLETCSKFDRKLVAETTAWETKPEAQKDMFKPCHTSTPEALRARPTMSHRIAREVPINTLQWVLRYEWLALVPGFPGVKLP